LRSIYEGWKMILLSETRRWRWLVV